MMIDLKKYEMLQDQDIDEEKRLKIIYYMLKSQLNASRKKIL